MSDPGPRSLPGEPSRVFGGRVGETYAAAEWPVADLIVDRERFASDGDWAFCRFESEAVPAVRMGFQAGSFEIGAIDRAPDRDRLQLHLEVMSAEGAYLWVPTSRFDATSLTTSIVAKDVRLEADGRELLRIHGWPTMEWHVRSDDDELEVRLEVDARTVTVLPDCLLPHVVFGMWETSAIARGEVRIGRRVHRVDGHMFYDHPRVLRVHHDVLPRQRYLYTTLALEDGSSLYAYHAEDIAGNPIGYYCFGILVDPEGRGTFLADARTTAIELDGEGIPRTWRFRWAPDQVSVDAEVTVRPLPLVRGWGGPAAPTSRASYVIFPLVLDAAITTRRGGQTRTLKGAGLAEYFDADAWPS